MKIKWSSNAIRQLDRVYEHYAAVDRKLAMRIFRTIQASARRLARFPESGRRGTIPTTRELVVTHLPFLIVYRIEDGGVEIIRVLHTATNWITAATGGGEG